MNNGDQPAFPYNLTNSDCSGLTKREMIAAMLAQGILANPNWKMSEAYAAEAAIVEADLLIKKLETK